MKSSKSYLWLFLVLGDALLFAPLLALSFIFAQGFILAYQIVASGGFLPTTLSHLTVAELVRSFLDVVPFAFFLGSTKVVEFFMAYNYGMFIAGLHGIGILLACRLHVLSQRRNDHTLPS